MDDVAVRPLVSASDLKRQRGWTEGLIGALLGAPDALCPNPHGFRPPMRWYGVDRVREAEDDPAFRRRLGQLSERQAWRRAQPTRQRLPAEVEHLEWLHDPALLALFHAPREASRRRRRGRAAGARTAMGARDGRPPGAAPLRFEVLRLF